MGGGGDNLPVYTFRVSTSPEKATPTIKAESILKTTRIQYLTLVRNNSWHICTLRQISLVESLGSLLTAFVFMDFKLSFNVIISSRERNKAIAKSIAWHFVPNKNLPLVKNRSCPGSESNHPRWKGAKRIILVFELFYLKIYTWKENYGLVYVFVCCNITAINYVHDWSFLAGSLPGDLVFAF